MISLVPQADEHGRKLSEGDETSISLRPFSSYRPFVGLWDGRSNHQRPLFRAEKSHIRCSEFIAGSHPAEAGRIYWLSL
jgi:hypothetical protein